MAWVGYANAHIRAQIEPLLQQALRARGLDRDDDGDAGRRDRSSRRCASGGCSSRGAIGVVSRARRDGSTSWAASPTTRGRSCSQRPIAEATWAAVQRIDRPGPRNRQPRPPSVHDPARHAGARRRARRATTRRGGCSPDGAASLGGLHRRRRSRARPRAGPAADVGRADRRSRRDVPEGKGVSSSAAVETASMTAVACAFGIALEPRDLALLCQKAENLVAGAPCGVMDQMTCVFGDAACAAGAPVPAGRAAAAGSPFRTTSNCGDSIRASVTRWAAPTTAPSARAHSWGCASSPSTCPCPGDYLANIAAERVRAGAGAPPAGGDVGRRVPRALRRHGGHGDARRRADDDTACVRRRRIRCTSAGAPRRFASCCSSTGDDAAAGSSAS